MAIHCGPGDDFLQLEYSWRMTLATRILICDDQALVRAGFKLILDAEDDLEVVGEAGDGEEALELVESANPEVILMDVRMPKMDGIDATRRITAQAGEEGPKVLILTTFDLDEYVYEALRAGASGFLLKDVPAEELAAAIRVVAAGDSLLAPGVTRRVIDAFVERPAPRPQSTDSRLVDLTPRELEVL